MTLSYVAMVKCKQNVGANIITKYWVSVDTEKMGEYRS